MKKQTSKQEKLDRKNALAQGIYPKLIQLPDIYPENIKKNYSTLIKKDLHIAEIYRVGTRRSPIPPSEINFNPFQVHLDEKKSVWIDVLIERKPGVSLNELSTAMQIHGNPGRSKIISGRVKVENLPRLEKKVLRLETSRPVSKALDKSLKFIKADQKSLENIQSPISGLDITGAGVIIGIIDDGCDFNHPNFKKPNGDTRLLFLWDQKTTTDKHPTKYPYGTEFNAKSINNALHNSPSNPYDINTEDSNKSGLGYKPESGAHGTHVMDIAAGKSANPNYVGVAPEADLIFVQLGSPTEPNEIENEERGTFGSSKYLVDAFNYIIEKAGNKPVVINMSLATNGGAHNGRALTDIMFDDKLKNKKRALVIAAGNAAEGQIHFSKEVAPNESCEIQWSMSGDENTLEKSWYSRYEMEIWYSKEKKMRVEIFKPSANAPLLTCAYNEETMSPDSSTKPLALVTNYESTTDEENHVDILIDHNNTNFKKGNWKIRLVNEENDDPDLGNTTIHAWIERNDQYPSKFTTGSTSECTINGIGTANLPIVVGAYDNSNEHKPIEYSGSGPSRNMQFFEKPEISAPGENITSARALSVIGSAVSVTVLPAARFTELTSSDENGTSMAAPHVTGIIALMFHAAKLAGRPVPKIEEIRQVLRETVISNEEGEYNNQLGYGRVNALEAIKKIIQI